MNKIIFLAIVLFAFMSCKNITSRYSLGSTRPKLQTISTSPYLVPNIQMHTDIIRKVAVDNDEKYIVTGSLDKTVRIWKYKKNRYECDLHKILRVPAAEGSEGKIYAVAISPNGKIIAVAGWTGLSWQRTSNIYLFNADNGQLIYRISGLPNIVYDLAFSKLGTRLVACLESGGIYVYDTLYYDLIHKDRYYDGAVYSADFNALDHLATVSADGHLRLYDQDFSIIKKIKTQGGSIPYSLCFSPDDILIAIGFADSEKVDVYSDTTLDFRYSPNLDALKSVLKNVCWGKDGSLYVSGKNQKKQEVIRRFPLDGSPKDILVQSKSEIQHMAALVNGDIAFCSTEPSFGVIAGDQLRMHKTSNRVNFRNKEYTFSLSPDGKHIHFSYSEKEAAYFSISPSQLHLSKPKNKEGRYIAFLPAIQKSQSLQIRNWKDSQKIQVNSQVFQSNSSIRSISIAPKKKMIALGTDHYLYLLDRDSNIIWKNSISSSAWRVNISRNEKMLVTAMGNGTICWYDLSTGQKMLTFFTINSNSNEKKQWIAWKNNKYASSPGGDSLAHEIRNKSTETIPGEQPLLAINKTVNEQINLEQLEQETLPELTSLTPKHIKEKKQSLYILSIGVSKYRESILNLDYAAKDAQNFYDKIIKQKHYEKVSGRIIIDKKATQIEILRGLDFIQENCTENDIAIIFLAGHGEKNNYGDYYFLPTDFYPKRGISKTAVEFNEIQNAISKIRGKTVLLLDTCRSGAVNINNIIADFESNKNQLMIISSASANQVALEGKDWNNGAFTKSLLEGLDGKASYKGQISIQQLYTYVSNRVKELTENKQTPTIMIPNSMSDFIIAKSELQDK